MNIFKNKKSSIIVLLIAVALILIAAFTGFLPANTASADSKQYFTAEEYTNSDSLLKEDGTYLRKDIRDFSDEVKEAANYASIPELAQVVPLQYLESQQQNATFSYNGKEYGFYMVKEGDYFDLLLIDFVYEFDDGRTHNNEYKIQIKPRLQQSFVRTGSAGSYEWRKYGGQRYTYYVANPRFLVTLENENSLNYGDSGYSKYEDDGLIIQQARTNYGKISYQTEGDLLASLGKFVAVQVLDLAVSFIPKVGDVIGVLLDVAEFGADLFSQSKEVTVLADNENNIFTQQSKTDQRNNNGTGGYSRAAGFLPKEEIILSAAEDSYAEFITVLNDTNYKSRLTQTCEFDIVRRSGAYSSMQYVAGNWENEEAEPLSFTKQRSLFAEEQPQFEITQSNIEGTEIPVYLLDNGTQNIEFVPGYTGNYKFETGGDISITVTGPDGEVAAQGGAFQLQMGKAYCVELTGKNKVISQLAVSVAENGNTGQLARGEKALVAVSVTQDDIYNILSGGSEVLIDNVLCAGDGGLDTYRLFSGYAAGTSLSVPLAEDRYYIVLYNGGSGASAYDLQVKTCGEGVLGRENTVNSDGTISGCYVGSDGGSSLFITNVNPKTDSTILNRIWGRFTGGTPARFPTT